MRRRIGTPSRAAGWLALWLAAALGLPALSRPGWPSPGQAHAGARAGQNIAAHAWRVLSQEVLAGADTLTHDYPAACWGWTQVRQSGNLPLWNPSWFCGLPFIASRTFMPFYPLNWIGGLLPFPLAFNIQYPLHLLLAAAVMMWSCRRRGLGWPAAGLAGLSWGFGGHLATLAGPGQIQKLQALAWLPLVALGGWRIGRGEAYQGFIPFAVGLALQITAGHLQIVYLTLALTFCEALAAAAHSRGAAERARPGYVPLDSRLAGGLIALALAAGLSAVFWVPVAEFARLSNRQGALNWEDATRGSLPPEEAFEFALPRLRGDSMPYGRGRQLRDVPFNPLYLGRYGESSTSSPERVLSDYVGAGVLVFAVFALLLQHRRRRAAWGYVALAAVVLILSLGKYLPKLYPGEHAPRFYAMALKAVPGLSHFLSPSAMMALLAYGLTMAAALGVQAFLRSPIADLEKREKAYRGIGSLMLLLAALAAVVMFRMDMVQLTIGRAVARPGDLAKMRELEAIFLGVSATRHASQGLFLVLAFAGSWAFLEAMPAGLRGRRAAGRLLLAGLALAWGYDLLANAAPFWNTVEAPPCRSSLTHHWAMPYWAAQDEPLRYLEVGNELSNRALTLTDFSRQRSLGTPLGFHPVAYKKYLELEERLGALNPNFLRLFNVSWLIWPEQAKRDWPAGFQEYARAEGNILLHNPEISYVHPLRHLKAVKDGNAVLDRLAAPGFNSYESTTVMEGEGVSAKNVGRAATQPEMKLQARVFPVAPGETLLRCATVQEGWIILSEPAVPGWRVWRRGPRDQAEHLEKKLPQKVDGFLLAILLYAGKTDVHLVYDPVSQRLGLYVSLVTLGLCAYFFGRRVKLRASRG